MSSKLFFSVAKSVILPSNSFILLSNSAIRVFKSAISLFNCFILSSKVVISNLYLSFSFSNSCSFIFNLFFSSMFIFIFSGVIFFSSYLANIALHSLYFSSIFVNLVISSCTNLYCCFMILICIFNFANFSFNIECMACLLLAFFSSSNLLLI